MSVTTKESQKEIMEISYIQEIKGKDSVTIMA
jgi:hypothetical protein